jgi:hypothetical protein
MVDGDLFHISQSSVSRIVERVSILLAEQSRRFIKFPNDLGVVEEQFRQIAGFPHVIGCVDGVHIPIKNPSGPFAEVYRNRKRIFSLNVQVCRIFTIHLFTYNTLY